MFGFLKSVRFLSKKDCKRVEEAIIAAEKKTSGEIRVHIESTSGGDPIKAAAQVFNGIGMDKTEQKNGVLIYLAIKDKEFAIIGDQGINEKVSENFWDDVKNEMQGFFKEGKFTEGIIAGVEKSGEKLKEFFPRAEDDVDELPNTISFGP